MLLAGVRLVRFSEQKGLPDAPALLPRFVRFSEQIQVSLDLGVLWAENPPESPLRRAVSNRSEVQHPLRRTVTRPGLVPNPSYFAVQNGAS